jgi:uncharacterized LabA/DUF88 family protein
MPERVSFLIDGFNVYHSVKDALAAKQITHGKWLDYRALCAGLLRDVGNFEPNAQIAKIRYFTAFASYLSNTQPDVVPRHKTFIAALEFLGIEVVLGNFKQKKPTCGNCKTKYVAHEEKETDVNIAIHLIKIFLEDECDTAVIISGDTDLIPALKMAKLLFPQKKVAIGFPFKRVNNHFTQIADFTFKIKAGRYEKDQLPDPVILSNGNRLVKPASW